MDTQTNVPSKAGFWILKKWHDTHKKVPGVKWQAVVSYSRKPKLIFFSGPYPGSASDISIAREKNGVLDSLSKNERAFADPGYHGDPRVYAPPKRNMKSYVKSLSDVGLTIQRAVERWNNKFKRWKIMERIRVSPTEKYDKVRDAGYAVAMLTSLDERMNPPKY